MTVAIVAGLNILGDREDAAQEAAAASNLTVVQEQIDTRYGAVLDVDSLTSRAGVFPSSFAGPMPDSIEQAPLNFPDGQTLFCTIFLAEQPENIQVDCGGVEPERST